MFWFNKCDNICVSKTIALNADDRQKALAEVLARRLGYRNVSDMIRDWLEKGFSEHISEDEQRQIIALYQPSAEKRVVPKSKTGRRRS